MKNVARNITNEIILTPQNPIKSVCRMDPTGLNKEEHTREKSK